MRASVAAASANKPTCFSQSFESCKPPFTVDLKRGSCDGAALKAADFFTAAAGTTPTFNPPLPAQLSPGQYTFTITGNTNTCETTVTVRPCLPACKDVTVQVGAGECTASVDPLAFVDPATVGKTAKSVALTPANPFPLGTTLTTAVVSYPGALCGLMHMEAGRAVAWQKNAIAQCPLLLGFGVEV